MQNRHSVLPRRTLLAGAAATAGALLLPARAPAQGGKKKLAGVTLHVACFSHTYSEFLRSYLHEFEEATGAKVIYETPSFPIYNQRMDIELATRSAAHDVINVTFIYSGRWVGAGWTTPLDDFFKDPKKTPADFDVRRFPARRDGGVPATGRVGCTRSPGSPISRWPAPPRYDLIEKAGFKHAGQFRRAADDAEGVEGKRRPGSPLRRREPLWLDRFRPICKAFGGSDLPPSAGRSASDAGHPGGDPRRRTSSPTCCAITGPTACCPTPTTRCRRR